VYEGAIKKAASYMMSSGDAFEDSCEREWLGLWQMLEGRTLDDAWHV
jgi:hypothetical protein